MKNKKNKFIRKILIFLIIIILAFILINAFYNKKILQKKITYRQEKSYQEYINNLDEKKIDFAFFGASNTMDGIDPEFIPNSFNFGRGGETSVQSYFKLTKVLDKDKIKIKTLILGVNLHTLSSLKRKDRSNLITKLWLYSKFMSYKEIKKISNKNLLSIWIESNFPFMGNGADFKILITKPKLRKIYRGWAKGEENFSNLNKKQEAYDRYKELFKDTKTVNEVNLEYLKKTLKLAKENEINIIFMTYPITRELDEVIIKQNISKQEPYQTIFNQADNILENYQYLDYYDLFFDNPDYFADADHLNYLGAEIFTKKIYEDIQNSNFTKPDFNHYIDLRERDYETDKIEKKDSDIFMFYIIILIFEALLLVFMIIFKKNLQGTHKKNLIHPSIKHTL